MRESDTRTSDVEIVIRECDDVTVVEHICVNHPISI